MDDVSRERRATSAQPVSSDTPLRPGAVEGLDADACARLCRLGIDNLGELVSAGALELARGTELALWRVTRWQALAAQVLGEPFRTLYPASRFSPTETAFQRRPTDLERELESRSVLGSDGHASAHP